jgi:threonine 3-dehydrogenase
MKQIVKAKPGCGEIQLVDVPVREPNEDEVLVKINAASICGTDMHIYNWNEWAQGMYEKQLPMPLGHEFCGIVVEIGENVKNVKVGDRVSAETHISCHVCDMCLQGRPNICDNLQVFSKSGAGCFSEYSTVPAECLVKVPENLSNEEASLLEPLGVSIYAVETAQVSGKSILFQGCGPLGMMGIQVAQALGASRIFVVEMDSYRIAVARELGADAVIDATKENVVERIMELTKGTGVRSICETSGSIPAMEIGFQCLAKGGRYVFSSMPSHKLSIDVAKYLVQRELVMTGCYGRQMYQTWHTAFELLGEKRVDLSKIISHRMTLEQYKDAFQAVLSKKSRKVIFLPK